MPGRLITSMNTDKYRYFEILAVLLTGLLKFIFMGLFDYRALYISLTCLFWIIYVYKRYQSDHTVLRNWGFQKENLLKLLVNMEFLFLGRV